MGKLPIDDRAGIELVGQREVARRSGVSRRTIARLMEGESVRSKVVAKIMRALKQGGRDDFLISEVMISKGMVTK
jgi:predicted transcriptional regulator